MAASRLSSRGKRATLPGVPYWSLHETIVNDLHHPETNPAGGVSLCIAENRLNLEPIREKLSANARVVMPDAAFYSNFIGRSRMRSAFAGMISHTVCRDHLNISAEQLCITAGCGSAIENLAFLLLEEGDGVILPTPTYAAFYNDIGTLPGGHIIDCPTDADGYRLTESALEAAYKRGIDTGHPPRILLLVHPSNPLGSVSSRGELTAALNFCANHGMHLVCDEIYANSVFAPQDDAPGFESVVEVMAHSAGVWGEGNVEAAASTGRELRHSFLGDNVHVVWGLSKDFGMSGFRIGAIYTHNAELFGAVRIIAGLASTKVSPVKDMYILVCCKGLTISTTRYPPSFSAVQRCLLYCSLQ